MTEQEAIRQMMLMKPSWMEDGKGLMGTRTPYKPSDKPKGEVGFRKHQLSIDAKADLGPANPQPMCKEASDGFTLTLSGVSNATCNSSGPTAGAIIPAVSWSSAFAVDGTFTLVPDGFSANLASWQVTIDFAPYDTFISAGCGGAGSPAIPVARTALLICHKGKLSFRITVVGASAFTGHYPYFFLAQDIEIGVSFDNELTVADTCTLGQDAERPTDYVIAAGTGGSGLIELI